MARHLMSLLTKQRQRQQGKEATHVTLHFEVGQRGHQLVQLPGGGGGRHPGLLLCRGFCLSVPWLLGLHQLRGAGQGESRNRNQDGFAQSKFHDACHPVFLKAAEGGTYMGEGTELSSSSRRLSTLGRTSSIPRPLPPRLGFSKTGGAVLPEVETPFSWIWWMTEGNGGAVSSVAEKSGMLDTRSVLSVEIMSKPILLQFLATLKHTILLVLLDVLLQPSAPAPTPLSN